MNQEVHTQNRGQGVATQAHLTEMFSSVQGEGPHVGVRQIFVRFYGCHLNCSFCDTPESVTDRNLPGFKPPKFRIEVEPGNRTFEAVDNPISVDGVVEQINRLDAPQGVHHSIAFTGGEPLVHSQFLAQLFPLLKAEGQNIYLETAGDLPQALDRVIKWVDYVAMDIKLPGVSGNEARWKEHEAFLATCAHGNTNFFVKVVVSADTDVAEFERAAQIVWDVAPETVFVIQPMTPFGQAMRAPSSGQLLEWHRIASRYLTDVRVIPQCHKMMGQL